MGDWQRLERTDTVLVDMPRGLRRWWWLVRGKPTVSRQTFTFAIWVKGEATLRLATGPQVSLEGGGAQLSQEGGSWAT